MTTPAITPSKTGSIRRAWDDIMTITWRNTIAMTRVPQVLIFSTIQPVIFILMFRYVFGGAISPGAQFTGVPYVDFLMPGIFVQTITFGGMSTGVGLAEDVTKGLIERFRSLPMARSAVLAGRCIADLLRNVFVFVLMLIVGFIVGFRIHTNPFALVGALLVMLTFAFALSWIFALLGLTTRNAEAAQAASFPLVAPLVFASSAFVPLSSQPGWMQVFSAHQPFTLTVNAVRALCIGGETLWPVVQAILWAIGITAVFAPLAVRKYRATA